MKVDNVLTGQIVPQRGGCLVLELSFRMRMLSFRFGVNTMKVFVLTNYLIIIGTVMAQHIMTLVGNDLRTMIYRMLHDDVYCVVKRQYNSVYVSQWEEETHQFNGSDCAALWRDLSNIGPVFTEMDSIYLIFGTFSKSRRPYKLPYNYQYSNG